MKKGFFFLLMVLPVFALRAQVVVPLDTVAPRDTTSEITPIIVEGDTSVKKSGKIKVYVADSSQIDTVTTIKMGKYEVTEEDIEQEYKNRAEKRRAKLELKASMPHDPKVAVRRSAILPGWGQVYNRSAWKVPIIYAGFGVFGYLYFDNDKNYKIAKDLYRCTADPNCADTDPNRTADSYRAERDFYRRNRDLQVIIAALWYGLNLVDAMVEAHLDGFDISDDISMRIEPDIYIDHARQKMVWGAGVTFNLKR